MFRMRRYRVFVVFAVIATGLLYHFTSLGEIESAGAASVEGLRHFGQKVESSVPPPAKKPGLQIDPEPQDFKAPIAALNVEESGTARPSQSETPRQSQAPATVKVPEKSATPSLVAKPAIIDDDAVNPKATPAEKHTPAIESPSIPTNKTSKPDSGPAEPIVNGGGGRLEIIAETNIPKIHWSQMPEHFPVPTENLIQLPTGKPKAIPRIQHDFAAETSEEKATREEKRDIIKKTFSFSWAGYKQKAWMQDELSPVTGKFRNPFCAWGATLVDTLDTLYMMDLKEEFEEAVEAVKDIDFTTTPRNDIPLFETVIRYLGGLVAAYDISEGTHRILLDKAVELADILMGAFDTPNRMPMTFYLWKPTFASQPHRAKTRVVLAELGSLSVEFTRLAQITKETKYYDAIARITNELEDWQNNTRLPGLWPMKVDASGCKKPDVSPQTAYDKVAMDGATSSKPLGIQDREVWSPKVPTNGTTKEDPSKESVKDVTGHNSSSENNKEPPPKPASNPDPPTTDTKGALGKRLASDEGSDAYHSEVVSKPPECEPQGLASPPFTSTEEFGIGGQADSTYEYLPKEYMLLGGMEEKYRTIYEKSADVITKHLLYRTMIPDEKRRILHPGLAKISDRTEGIDFKPEGSHLGCFAGGMYAVGAKIFDREGDMKIAKELTDGCVWAYEATTTGIMPDGYIALQCPDPMNCAWNETLYHEKLDPFGHLREKNRLAQQQNLIEADKASILDNDEVITSPAKPTHSNTSPQKLENQPGELEGMEKADTPSQAKADQKPQNPLESNMLGSDPDSTDDGVLKSSAEKLPTVPEQSAEHSAPLPMGGANAEQPISPPSSKEAAPSISRKRRQLGDIEETPITPASVDSAKSAVEPPASEVAKAPIVSSTITEPDRTKPHDNVPGARQPNGTSNASHPAPQATSYTPPSIPTHEEFVKARIKDERLPVGMTKVTGPRYVLRSGSSFRDALAAPELIS